MFCSNCGVPLPGDSNFCYNCGVKIYSTQPSFRYPNPQNYLKDIGFQNSSPVIGKLIAEANSTHSVGLILLILSIPFNFMIGPLVWPVFILTIPMLITSIVFLATSIGKHNVLKRMYINYLNQYGNQMFTKW